MTNKISVIVPVYNVERFVGKCLEQITNQTYKNLEIIVVNDGSTDTSMDVVKRYKEKDDRIIVIEKENGGLSSARNVGIDCASGEYIGFVDSDDYPQIDMYEKLLESIKTYHAQIAICNYGRNENEFVSIENKVVEMTREKAFEELARSVKFQSHAWSKLYDRELFKDVRYPVGKLYEDIYTTYKLFDKSNKIVYTNQKLYFYRINEESITNQTFRQGDMDLVESSQQLYDFYVDKGYNKAASLQRDCLTRNAISIMKKMYDLGEYNKDNINTLIMTIKAGYPQYLVSKYRLCNRVFGLVAIIDNNLLFKLYKYLHKEMS